jgi:hypothetical protein
MKIVVSRGSGLIETKLVKRQRLREAGHEIIAASPRSGVNSITGDGLFGLVPIKQAQVFTRGTRNE